MTRQVKAELSIGYQQYVDGMNKAAKATRETATEAQKLAEQREAFTLLGRTALASGAVIAAGLGVAVAKFAEFDQAMSNVAATGEDARDNIEGLRDAALEAGATTVFSATESANAIEELAKAGLDASEILGGALKGSLDLAAAAGIGVAEAAEIAATTLQQFSLDGSDATHVADLLAAGAGKAMGNVGDISQALGQAGLVADQFGVSVEETVGSLAAFASAGLLGSDAGTSFRTMLLRLANPTGEVRDLMKEIGFEAYDAQGKFIGLSGLAGELETSLAGMTDEQKQTTLAMIFGQDAIRGATVLYEEGAEGIEDWTNKVDDAGYAAETAATKLDNLKGDWEALSGAVDTALISMGEAADGPLRFFTQGLTTLVDKFNEIPAAGQQAVFWIGAVASATGLAYGAYLLLIPKVAEFNAALEVMSPRTRAVAEGLGMVAKIGGGAIAGLAVGVVALDALTQALKDIGPEAEVVANKVTSARNAVDLLASSAGKFGGSGIELATQQLEELGAVLDRGGATGASDIIGNSTISNLQLLGTELGKIADSDLPAAQRQFRLLADAANLTEEQQLLLLDQMPEYKSALTDQATASGVAADGQELLDLALGQSEESTKENEDALRALAGQAQLTGDEVDGLADQIRNFGSATLSVRDAQRQFEQATDDVSDAVQRQIEDFIKPQEDAYLEANGTLDGFVASMEGFIPTLDTATQLGRDAEASLDDLAESTLELSAATLEQTGSQEDANDVIADGRQRLIEVLEQFGITGQAAEDYADDLGLIPENIDTAVALNTSDATKKLQSFFDSFNGRQITFSAAVTGQSVPVGTGTVLLPGRASGGAISGPGGPTDDSAGVYALSDGEHVMTAADVAAMGGQHAVYAFRDSLHSGGGGGAGRTPQPVIQNIYPQPGMSEEQIGRAAARSLEFEMRSS
jgi:TP901 family phage tail tape measure protein